MTGKIKYFCGYCGKETYKYKSAVHGTNVFCSIKCKQNFMIESSLQKGSIISSCKQCGKEMLISPCYQKKGSKKFCSKPCLDEYRKERSINRVCENCGKTISVYSSSDLAKLDRVFCSQACYYEYRQKKYSLEGKTDPKRKNVCSILQTHYDELQDDPERLSTSFMKKLIGTKKNCINGGEI